MQLENARLSQERTNWKVQAETESEARKRADAKVQQLEMDLLAAQGQVEKLEQQKTDFSSKACSLNDKAERSSQALEEIRIILQKWQAVLLSNSGGEYVE